MTSLKQDKLVSNILEIRVLMVLQHHDRFLEITISKENLVLLHHRRSIEHIRSHQNLLTQLVRCTRLVFLGQLRLEGQQLILNLTVHKVIQELESLLFIHNFNVSTILNCFGSVSVLIMNEVLDEDGKENVKAVLVFSNPWNCEKVGDLVVNSKDSVGNVHHLLV
jgi:hypothetical protein